MKCNTGIILLQTHSETMRSGPLLFPFYRQRNWSRAIHSHSYKMVDLGLAHDGLLHRYALQFAECFDIQDLSKNPVEWV